jgi:uncharacterized protein with von Willebrand factor type A (vWA) domain
VTCRSCLEYDGYDRELWQQLREAEEPLRVLIARAQRLLPHGDLLIFDLFLLFFKMNLLVREPAELASSVLLHRRLLAGLVHQPGTKQLRQRTQLNELQSAMAVVAVGSHLLHSLTRDSRVVADELVDVARVARAEDELAELDEQLEQLQRLGEQLVADDEARQRLQTAVEQDYKEKRRHLDQARERLTELAQGLPEALEAEVGQKVAALPAELERLDDQLQSLGWAAGGDGEVSAHSRLELGERLLQSRKLQMLARLVGAFRDVAFEARRCRLSRLPQEAHHVETGAELQRLLPSELLALATDRPGLRRDFYRRFSERQLLHYALAGAAQRGPLVICLDGSGSMGGSKELWGKAVALTLIEIARRERRRCLALVFSAGAQLFEVELLGRRRAGNQRAPVDELAVLKFAEHFPGGGTSFEEPLTRAVEAVTEGNYRRGDVVFITDGQAALSPQLVQKISRQRRRHPFRIWGIEVDVQQSRSETLAQFCDVTRRVTDLASDSLADLFAAL